MKILKLLLVTVSLAFFSCNSSSDDNLVVLVKYKTQPNKNVDAVVALEALIAEVKKEDHFGSIRMFVDPDDNSNILLYEEWEDESYYKGTHMETSHLQKFIGESRSFLAGPPEISYWKLNSTYK